MPCMLLCQQNMNLMHDHADMKNTLILTSPKKLVEEDAERITP